MGIESEESGSAGVDIYVYVVQAAPARLIRHEYKGERSH